MAGKAIDIQAGFERLLHIFNTIGQRKGDLLHGRRTGLAHVVATDRNCIPLGHFGGAIAENVGDQPHGRPRREDIGATGDIFFENVILDGAAQLVGRHALLLAHSNDHRQQNRGRRVNRHANAHLVERDAVEQRFHVVQAADRDADFAHFTFGQLMIGVIANLRGQVKGDGKAGLATFEQIVVAAIALGRGAKTGILAHGP